MGALREIAASFGISVDAKPLDKLDTRIRETLSSVYRLNRAAPGSEAATAASEGVELLGAVTKRFTTVVGAAAVALAVFAHGFAAQAHEARAAATTLRVTTAELQSARNGFELAGLSSQDAATAFATFHRNVRAAATSGGDAGGAFYRLGIRLRDGDRQVRSSSDVLDAVAERFERVQNPARRARMAVQLFGDAGLQLLPVLHRGAGGLAELRRETELLGGGLSGESIEAARGFELAMTRWRIVGDATRSQLAVGLLPAITWLIDRVRGAQLWFTRMLQSTHGVRNGLAVLGVAAAAVAAALIVAWAPVIAPFLGAAAAVGALYLLIDDFVTFLEGGQSVIGAFMDELFGPGTANAVREHLIMVGQLREAWEGVQTAVHDALAALGLAESQTAEQRQGASDAAIRRAVARDQERRRQMLAGHSPALAGPATATGTIPITVTAPARAAPTVVSQRTVAPQIHVHGGNASARQIADEVLRRVRDTERDAHDASHPQQPRDE